MKNEGGFRYVARSGEKAIIGFVGDLDPDEREMALELSIQVAMVDAGWSRQRAEEYYRQHPDRIAKLIERT